MNGQLSLHSIVGAVIEEEESKGTRWIKISLTDDEDNTLGVVLWPGDGEGEYDKVVAGLKSFGRTDPVLEALKNLERAAGGECVNPEACSMEHDIDMCRNAARRVIADAEGSRCD